jgi:hypothetical protein
MSDLTKKVSDCGGHNLAILPKTLARRNSLHWLVELSRCAANEKAVGLDLDVYGEHTAAQGG